MKVASIIGTRPNFIKEYSINRAFKKKGIKEVIIHTGQHYDFSMSNIFFKELSIPQPDYIAEILKGRHGQETAAMLSFIEDILIQEKPTLTLVYGDVNSTVAGALASAKLKIPVAHIEAGLRTESRNNPEEINRRVADTLSSVLFPHIKEAYDSLIKEHYHKDDVFLVGDVMLDSLNRVIKEFSIKVTKGDYLLVTLHREENTDTRGRLLSVVDALIESKEHIKFPLHPRTEKKLREFKLYEKLCRAPSVEILKPLGYVEFVRLLAGARKVLTDSGGVRREAYMLKKPVITLIDIIWVPRMVEIGWSKVVDVDKKKILDSIRTHDPKLNTWEDIFGDGKASERVADILMKRYG